MEDLIYRLRKRAEIRRSISTRKSVIEGKPDRISDLLEEAAIALENKVETLTREEFNLLESILEDAWIKESKGIDNSPWISGSFNTRQNSELNQKRERILNILTKVEVMVDE